MPAVRSTRPLIATAIIAALVAGACSADDTTNPFAPFGLGLSLSPSPATIFVSDSIAATDVVVLRVSATSFGAPIITPAGVVWSSSDETVALVNQVGVVHAIRVGSATITARINDTKATDVVTVAYRAAVLTLTPTTLTALVNDTVTFTAIAVDAAGKPVPQTSYIFSVSDPTASTVTPLANGKALVKFLKTGAARVSVTANGQTRDATGTIQAREFISTATNASTGALALSAGEDATCGLLPLGRGNCFGIAPLLGVARDSSCFGDRGMAACTLVPLGIARQISLTGVSVGETVACGATADNRAYCWGAQTYGQLGNGVAVGGSSLVPALVVAGGSANPFSLSRVTAGGNHACGLTPTNTAWCWGQDSVSQLGNGDGLRVNSSTPIPVGGGATYSAISAGRTHTCALRTDGIALCWGDNTLGQVGTGGVGDIIDSPTAAAGAPAFASISSGGSHTCALTATGAAWCWGSNDSGQVGRGLGAPNPATPAPVAGGQTFRSISAGRYSTCAVTTAGAAFCWGSNEWGQIGDGGRGAPRATPAPVVGGRTDFTSIAVGRRHACASGASGAWCWGSNLYGALGNGLQALIQPSPMKTSVPQ